jgi:hypothetical protein
MQGDEYYRGSPGQLWSSPLSRRGKDTSVSIHGSMHPITTIGETVTIGCQSGSLRWWLKHNAAMARKFKYTESQAAEYLAYLKAIEICLDAQCPILDKEEHAART